MKTLTFKLLKSANKTPVIYRYMMRQCNNETEIVRTL